MAAKILLSRGSALRRRVKMLEKLEEAKMNKKNHVVDEEVQLAWRYYAVGNFYRARKLARRILMRAQSLMMAQVDATSILTMTRADSWALLAGAGVLLFVVMVAFGVAY